MQDTWRPMLHWSVKIRSILKLNVNKNVFQRVMSWTNTMKSSSDKGVFGWREQLHGPRADTSTFSTNLGLNFSAQGASFQITMICLLNEMQHACSFAQSHSILFKANLNHVYLQNDTVIQFWILKNHTQVQFELQKTRPILPVTQPRRGTLRRSWSQTRQRLAPAAVRNSSVCLKKCNANMPSTQIFQHFTKCWAQRKYDQTASSC